MEGHEFSDIERVFVEPPRDMEFGWHRENGIFLSSSPDIKEKHTVQANIIDLAPTILHIYNVTIPKEMDGRVIKEIFNPSSKLSTREPLYSEYRTEIEQHKYSDDEKKKIQNRLEALGYY
jgi:hypothetical protein